MKKMSSIALCGKDFILTSSSPISISSSSYSSSLSSSSSSVPTNTSQFGFVPPSGQPDLQSRTGPRVRGSAEKAAHQGQVLSGLPHECHGPGTGKGSCNAKKEKKHKNPPCDRLSPAWCILGSKAKRLKGTPPAKLNLASTFKIIP